MKDSPIGEITPNRTDRSEKNITRLVIRVICSVIILIISLSGCTLRKTRMYRVGILSGLDAFLTITDGFKEKMIELGYIEGKNIVYDYWKLNDDPVEEEKVINKFIVDKVDLILVSPSRPAKTAKMLTQGTGIPVVFAGAGIEGTDLVKSQREPGDNITGVRFPNPELTAKRLELLLELAPNVERVMIMYDSSYTSYQSARQAIDDVTVNKHIVFVEYPVASLEDIKTTLEMLDNSVDIGIDAIFLMPDILTGSIDAWEIIKPFVIDHNLPVASSMEHNFIDAGLILLNSSHYEIGSLAAVITDKILRGTPAGSIPVATPNLNLYINYRRAQELGLTVPDGLLKQAYEIIQ